MIFSFFFFLLGNVLASANHYTEKKPGVSWKTVALGVANIGRGFTFRPRSTSHGNVLLGVSGFRRPTTVSVSQRRDSSAMRRRTPCAPSRRVAASVRLRTSCRPRRRRLPTVECVLRLFSAQTRQKRCVQCPSRGVES